MNKYNYRGSGLSPWYCSNPNKTFQGQEQDPLKQKSIVEIPISQRGTGVQWVAASKGSIPLGAITAGYEADGTPLYVARAHHSKGLHIGKIKPVSNGATIPIEGVEVLTSFYEVLVLT
ncbi:DM9 repeat-containing protein [Anaeromicrobium sediminis]|uniref:DM9 repeat-containing protein n=1 Tax=Anaeromicrobium sediminis TaxID=1478221 RepID=UPI001595794D|nr:DM9 repeat-containing protein [Anaeromicrobium sediminis]